VYTPLKFYGFFPLRLRGSDDGRFIVINANLTSLQKKDESRYTTW